MQICVISPIKHLELDTGSIHMVIPQLLEIEPYYDFYANRSDYVILDNGAVEFGAMGNEELIELAKEIKANEIVMPDRLCNGLETFNLSFDFYCVLSKSERKQFKIMAVPQGKDLIDFVNCYTRLKSLNPDVIGLNHWFDSTGESRTLIQKRLDVDMFNSFEVHLLGLTNAGELNRSSPKVRSCDTSYAFKMAYQNRVIGYGDSDVCKIQMDFGMDLTEGQLNIAEYNIKWLKSLP